MADWDLPRTTWHHAVNTPPMLDDALSFVDKVFKEQQQQREEVCLTRTEGDVGEGHGSSGSSCAAVPVIGIEIDLRELPASADSPQHTPIAVLRHDPFDFNTAATTKTPTSGRADTAGGGEYVTLEAFFRRVAGTDWFLSRQRAAGALPRGKMGRPPCRLVIKLDFKDTGAARGFAAMIKDAFTVADTGADEAASPATTSAGRVLRELCRVLICGGGPATAMVAEGEEEGEGTEMMLWWNADVCPSDSTASGSGSDNAANTAAAVAGKRFIDYPQAETIALIHDTLHAVPRPITARAFGLSFGWVIKPPPPQLLEPHPPAVLPPAPLSSCNGGAAYYTSDDAARMAGFIAALFPAAQRPGEAPAAAPVRLVTFAVLFEAVFRPAGAPPPESALVWDTIRNRGSVQALQQLLHHTQQTCHPSSPSSSSVSSRGAAPAGSARCTLTFWKAAKTPVPRAVAAQELAAAGRLFERCLIDGPIEDAS